MSDSHPTRAAGRPRRAGTSRGGMPQQVGRYEVECELGRGGMGVVYRARDMRLDRLVALKALPSHVAADGEARDRFEREARLLASLEHPHVAAIHGIEDSDAGSFLVLQHVQGETLASRLRRGPLPLADALAIAAQAAEGVAAAHRRGIIHCDLKPGNVMVTEDGTVKLLDFGIATRWRDPSALTTGGSGYDGLSGGYGTPAYMSPEQIAGAPLDPRTDVWSFGCTLFECLAGRPTFDSDNPKIVMAMVESAEPDWGLVGDAPASVRDLLAHCLAKNRNERAADMESVRTRITQALSALRGSAAQPERATLPRPLSSFVGREPELGDVLDRLHASRLVTLTGSAGCGKSRLALEAGSRWSAQHGVAAWLAALAPLSDAAHVAGTVAAAVDARKDSGPADRAVVAALRDRAGLLVLDNCEHVLAESARLAETILGGCPGIRILATSREALGVPGETSWRVPSLAHAKDVAESDAVQLFVARAREARPGFALDDESARTIGAIIERLDGIPLAIELAAARMKVLGPEQILERLSDRFRLLTGGSRTALERHQTLRGALEWSYGLLGDDEKRCFREIGVFAGGFRLEEAVRACTGGEFEVIDLVTSLVSKSLVQVEADGRSAPRYSLLESVRQHALAKLEDAGEAGAVRDRHRDAYVAVAEAIGKESGDLVTPATLKRFAEERDNLRAALEWSLSDPASSGHAVRIATSLVDVWDFTGQWVESRGWLERTMAAPGVDADPAWHARLVGATGRMAWWLADLPQAEALFRRALDMQRALGDLAQIATCLMQCALPLHTRGEFAEARRLYEESIELARGCGALRLECDAANNLCILTRDGGELESAEEHGRNALRIAQARGDERRKARSLRLLGGVLRDRGDHEQAEAHVRASLAINEARGNLRDAIETRVDLAHVLAYRGDAQSARDEYWKVYEVKRSWREPAGQAVTMANVAEMDMRLGRLDDARREFFEALGHARRSGSEPYMASIVAALAELLVPERGAAEGAALLACAGAARERMGRRLVGRELEEWESHRASLRAELGDEAFDAAWREGASRALVEQVDALLGE